MSAEGRRGRYGGSITLSHAFDDDQMQATYKERFRDTSIKQDIECLFWKESLRVSRFIQQHAVKLDVIFFMNSQLRFLMPVRNPIDCALSNMKTGHGRALVQSEDELLFEEVLDGVLREFRWFIDLQSNYPDRFFYFIENEFDKSMVLRLAHFLGIEPEPTWVDDVVRNYNIRHPHEYTRSMKDDYYKRVHSYFDAYPGIRDRLNALPGS